MSLIDGDARSRAATGGSSVFFALLRRRYFRRLWAITTVSSIGNWVSFFALVLFVQQLTGRPEFAVGGVLLFRVLPGLFFGPFAGVLADRFDRRRLMIAADLLRAGLVVSIPWIHNLWVLFLISAAMEVLQLIWAPAKDATLPNLVKRSELMLANQLSLMTTYATFPLGGAIVASLAGVAGLLGRVELFGVLQETPIALAFFVNAVTFLFAAAMVATFPVRFTKVARAPGGFNARHAIRDLGEGFRFVARDPVVRSLVMGAWVAFTGGAAVVALGPIFVRRLVVGVVAADAAWGVLIVAVGVGLVSGMLLAGVLARHLRRDRLAPAGLMLSGAGVCAVAFATTLPPTILFAAFGGMGAGMAWVSVFTMVQLRVEDRLRGRTLATLYTGIQLSLSLSLAAWPILAGFIGDRTVRVGQRTVEVAGVRIALLLGGIFLMLAGGALATGLRRARRPRPVEGRLRGLRLRPAGGVAGGARGGLFLVFEGGEGSGKSTQVQRLADALAREGREVVVTREPGGVAIAERVREILLDPAAETMDPKAEALLYAASRAQHAAEVIRPALERGAVVVSDRFIDSSLAYQGFGRGLGAEDVYRLNVWATDELLPDLVLLLHVDPEVGLARRGEGGRDRIEAEDLGFHQRVADGYLSLARTYPGRFAVIDASPPADQVHHQVMTTLLPFLRPPGEETVVS